MPYYGRCFTPLCARAANPRTGYCDSCRELGSLAPAAALHAYVIAQSAATPPASVGGASGGGGGGGPRSPARGGGAGSSPSRDTGNFGAAPALSPVFSATHAPAFSVPPPGAAAAAAAPASPAFAAGAFGARGPGAPGAPLFVQREPSFKAVERATVDYELVSMNPARPPAGFGPLARLGRRAGDVAPRALVVVTAYNEGLPLVAATLLGVLDNLERLMAARGAASRDRRVARAAAALEPAGVTCLLVFDGRAKVDASHFGAGGLLTAADRDGMAAAAAAGAAARAGDAPRGAYVADLHLFDRHYVRDERGGFARAAGGAGAGAPAALRLLVAVKEANGGKLSSHAWAFRAFARALQTDFLLLLDAGTRPEPTACLRLLGTMLLDASVGGCCGEICVAREQRALCGEPGAPGDAPPARRELSACGALGAPLERALGLVVVMAQVFEYTSSNAIDKTFESMLGFVSVLPGAFSAYRMRAIEGRPLEEYFRLEESGAAQQTPPWIRNMVRGGPRSNSTRAALKTNPRRPPQYLAEDRILGFEVVAKARDPAQAEAWVLSYDSGAAAYTDVPDSVGKLVSQRRRWLNGSFFAALYAIGSWRRLTCCGGTRHGPTRQLGFYLLLLYNVINILLSWFSIGNSYFALRLVVDLAAPLTSAPLVAQGFYVFTWLWQLTHVALLMWSLGNRATDSHVLWSSAAGVFFAVSVCTVCFVSFRVAVSSVFSWTAGAGAVGTCAVAALLHGQLRPIVVTAPFYLAAIPLFTILIPIYSWSNTNDLSWGTRPTLAASADVAAAAKRVEELDKTARDGFRSRVLFAWVASNWVLAQALSHSAGLANATTVTLTSTALIYYGWGLGALTAFVLGTRVCFSILYALSEAAYGWA